LITFDAEVNQTVGRAVQEAVAVISTIAVYIDRPQSGVLIPDF
jgi:hypothetical protein